jgi:hypothetical protein
MSDNQPPAETVDQAAETGPETDTTIPLDSWCQEKSASDSRVELLGVFAHRERAAGRHHDTPDAYLRRFNRLESSPVGG